MQQVDQVITLISEAFEALGIETAHIASYQGNANFADSTEIVIAGYLPGHACLVTAKANIDIEVATRYEISIVSEVHSGAMVKQVTDIPHNGGGGRSQYQVSVAQISNSFPECIDFVRRVRAVLTNEALKGSFTYKPYLHYVPYNSAEYDTKVEAFSGDSYLAGNWFNDQVIMNLPEGLLPITQQ